jgi:hypothetical protein
MPGVVLSFLCCPVCGRSALLVDGNDMSFSGVTVACGFVNTSGCAPAQGLPLAVCQTGQVGLYISTAPKRTALAGNCSQLPTVRMLVCWRLGELSVW